jgi:glycosyltransferase involved in cell wall biosynthesis
MERRPILVHILTDPMSFWHVQGQSAVMSQAGFDVHLISSPGAMAQQHADREHTPFHPVPMARRIAPWSDLVSLMRLRRTLKRLRPRVVQAGTPKAGLLGTIAAWLLRVPVRIYYVHGLPVLTARGVRRALLLAAERVACAAATHVVCVSPSIRHELVARGLCLADKATVLANGSCNGIDLSQFDRAALPAGTREAVRRRLDLPLDAVVVGFIGRVVREKGICELYRAWCEVRQRCQSAYLLIIGPPETTDPVPADTWHALTRDARVRITGPDWNTPPLYQAMDLVCLPSHREGCPTVPMEAAAMELPVVAFGVPGVVDTVDDGVTGRLVEPHCVAGLADALLHYLDNPERRTGDGQAGRRHIAALFRREIVWAALFNFYAPFAREAAAPAMPAPDSATHECTEAA